MKRSLRFLLEAFMPREARFPDEKFWTQSNDPIRMKSGGPPEVTSATTSKDWGVRDEPDEPNITLQNIEIGWPTGAHSEIFSRGLSLLA